jgi:hypothetical protein
MPAYLDESFWDEVDSEIDGDLHAGMIEFL